MRFLPCTSVRVSMLMVFVLLLVSVDVRAQVSALEQRIEEGRTVFAQQGNCFACHGPAGRGTPVGPDLTDGAWVNVDGSYARIAGLIRSGVSEPERYPAPMPPMGGADLSDAEVRSVAAYVWALAREPASPTVAARELAEELIDEVQATLEGLIRAQTRAREETGEYDRSPAFAPASEGVRYQVQQASGTGWAAEASHALVPDMSCVVYAGEADVPVTAAGRRPEAPGAVACDTLPRPGETQGDAI